MNTTLPIGSKPFPVDTKTVKEIHSCNLKPLSFDNQLELESYPFAISIPIRCGNKDCYRALSYMDSHGLAQSGYINYLCIVGLSTNKDGVNQLAQRTGIGRGLAIKNHQMKFIFPMFYPDTMKTDSKVSKCKNGRVEMYIKFCLPYNSCLASEKVFQVYCLNCVRDEKIHFKPKILNAVKELQSDPLKANESDLNIPFRIYSNL